MSKSVIGRKIGMTQVFSQKDKVVPVTAIDVSNWLVTSIKSKDRDGYDAVQIGLLRNKYVDQTFSPAWVKKPKEYFYALNEIEMHDLLKDAVIGQPVNLCALLEVGQNVDVSGITKGHGFQGVVKRHGFTGGRASHGPRFGRIPGSLGFMRSQGRVIKGKKLPGHMGVVHRVIKNLEVVRIEPNENVILVKGAVPGSCGSLIFMRKV
jgi:large subunit ribosomal protein L3